MLTHRGSSNFSRGPATAVTWGVFDGVHRGHRHVLDTLVREARARSLASVAITFHPHPGEVLRGTRLPILTTLDQRARRIADAGIDHLVIEPFTLEFSRTPADVFVRTIAQGRLGARFAVLGHDSAFGQGRQGDVNAVRAAGLDAVDVEPLLVDGAPISSSRVREAVSAGGMEEAERLLGRPYELWGVVEKGAGRGSRIGIPTANLPIAGQTVPGVGVYGCEATVHGREFRAVANVGRRPTFEGAEAPIIVETHLLEFTGEPLHGERIEVRFLLRLREERRFGSADALVAQIRADIEEWSHGSI